MSIDLTGLNDRLSGVDLTIKVGKEHPLILLGNALPWDELSEIVLPDLKSSTKAKCWWMGRPLRLRIHLGVYLLQQLFNKTDRQTEYDVKDNAAYQLFCGRSVVRKWHCPDHTKIEEFRSRLSPETQQKLANHLAKVAVGFGFAEPNSFDIDSTIQEANMAYPSDIHLLTQLGVKAKKIWSYMKIKFSICAFEPIEIDLKAIKEHARTCYFSKSKDKQIKSDNLDNLWDCAFSQIMPVINKLKVLDDSDFSKMPWHLKRIATQLKEDAYKYFLDVARFLSQGTIEPTKRLCFHLKEVACFNKSKPGKKYQFGRAFQLGRLGGNFLIVGKSNSVRMEDKQNIVAMVETHKSLFSNNTTTLSVTADKGYYSKANAKYLKNTTSSNTGLQIPGNVKSSVLSNKTDDATELINRRAGIEPLIGHAKHGGQLNKSRMKYDQTTESSGYAAILGFNARQLIRYLKRNPAIA